MHGIKKAATNDDIVVKLMQTGNLNLKKEIIDLFLKFKEGEKQHNRDRSIRIKLANFEHKTEVKKKARSLKLN